MKKKIILSSLIVLILSVMIFKDHIVEAGAPYFIRVNATNTATSTLSYMTAGTATTSLIADIYKVNGVGEVSGDMDLRIAVQYTASSTASTLKWRYEYSNGSNCQANPGNCDWYSESINNAAGTATTTIETMTFKEYSWVFASSTPGAILIPKDRALKIITVPILAQYVRVLFYMPNASLPGAVWAEVICVSQRF